MSGHGQCGITGQRPRTNLFKFGFESVSLWKFAKKVFMKTLRLQVSTFIDSRRHQKSMMLIITSRFAKFKLWKSLRAIAASIRPNNVRPVWPTGKTFEELKWTNSGPDLHFKRNFILKQWNFSSWRTGAGEPQESETRYRFFVLRLFLCSTFLRLLGGTKFWENSGRAATVNLYPAEKFFMNLRNQCAQLADRRMRFPEIASKSVSAAACQWFEIKFQWILKQFERRKMRWPAEPTTLHGIQGVEAGFVLIRSGFWVETLRYFPTPNLGCRAWLECFACFSAEKPFTAAVECTKISGSPSTSGS